MIFAEDQAVETLTETLRNHYYEPRGLSADVHIFRPVEGSGALPAV